MEYADSFANISAANAWHFLCVRSPRKASEEMILMYILNPFYLTLGEGIKDGMEQASSYCGRDHKALLVRPQRAQVSCNECGDR